MVLSFVGFDNLRQHVQIVLRIAVQPGMHRQSPGQFRGLLELPIIPNRPERNSATRSSYLTMGDRFWATESWTLVRH